MQSTLASLSARDNRYAVFFDWPTERNLTALNHGMMLGCGPICPKLASPDNPL